jgi:hypothetical protein
VDGGIAAEGSVEAVSFTFTPEAERVAINTALLMILDEE